MEKIGCNGLKIYIRNYNYPTKIAGAYQDSNQTITQNDMRDTQQPQAKKRKAGKLTDYCLQGKVRQPASCWGHCRNTAGTVDSESRRIRPARSATTLHHRS